MNYTYAFVPVGDAIDAGDDLITVNVGARACTEIKQRREPRHDFSSPLDRLPSWFDLGFRCTTCDHEITLIIAAKKNGQTDTGAAHGVHHEHKELGKFIS